MSIVVLAAAITGALLTWIWSYRIFFDQQQATAEYSRWWPLINLFLDGRSFDHLSPGWRINIFFIIGVAMGSMIGIATIIILEVLVL